MSLRSPAWEAHTRVMQRKSIAISAGSRVVQRSIERTPPLTSSGAYKRIARDAQFRSTKAPGIPTWTLRMFTLSPIVEFPPRLTAVTYESSSVYPQIVAGTPRAGEDPHRAQRRRGHPPCADRSPHPTIGFRHGRL